MTAVVTPLVAAGLVALTVIAWAGLARRQRAMELCARVARSSGSGDGASPAWFARLLGSVGIAASPDAAWPAGRGTLIVVMVLAGVWVPLLALGAVLVCGAGILALPVLAAPRRTRAFEQNLIEVTEGLASRLSVGATLRQAVEQVSVGSGPVATELRSVAAAQQRGAPVGPAFDAWAVSCRHGGARLLADAIALAGSSGGSQARALRGVVGTLRDRQSLGREVAALGTQARSSAAVLVVTPIGFATLAAVFDPRVGAVLLRTPLGWGCVSVGLALDVAGACWMHRMTRWAT